MNVENYLNLDSDTWKGGGGQKLNNTKMAVTKIELE